jgi:hypothetical protein
MLYPFLAMLCPSLAMLFANAVMLHPFLGMHRPLPAMLCPFLAMLRAFPAMLHVFAPMPCEGEDAVPEESRGHHALHWIRDASLGREDECVGSSSERETMRPAYLEIPKKYVGTPRESLGGCAIAATGLVALMGIIGLAVLGTHRLHPILDALGFGWRRAAARRPVQEWALRCCRS